MKKSLAKNIARYRKEKKFTQDSLAKKIGVSFQAVSKWETGQTMPDIGLLPRLSLILEVSIDKLLGYPLHDKQVSIYEEEYKITDYYWGVTPSKMCLNVMDIMPPTHKLKLLDIGCGEGKDAVFFARNGYDVTGFDISDAGIKKAEQLAKNAGVKINLFKADLLDFRLEEEFDIIYSSGVFHYIKPSLRNELIENYKENTNVNGLHAFNVFVNKPFIDKPPEYEPTAHNWITGELFTHYRDWYVDELSETIFDCNSSGVAHKHAMNTIYTRNIKK